MRAIEVLHANPAFTTWGEVSSKVPGNATSIPRDSHVKNVPALPGVVTAERKRFADHEYQFQGLDQTNTEFAVPNW